MACNDGLNCAHVCLCIYLIYCVLWSDLYMNFIFFNGKSTVRAAGSEDALTVCLCKGGWKCNAPCSRSL
jgi:hypothetical protein